MKFIFVALIYLFCVKNLSAYEQISIQKTDYLRNYNDLIEHITNSASLNDISIFVEKNIFNINFSKDQISFDLDIDQLSRELYGSNLVHNLFLLKCSLKENFYQFNQSFLNCPSFRIIAFNQQKFIYLNYLDNFYRIKEHSTNDSLQSIWMNMIVHNENINEISIQPNNYIKLVEYLGVDPKINSYENNFINVSFKSSYNNDNIHFLLNFF
jgi:hypothetical protein